MKRRRWFDAFNSRGQGSKPFAFADEHIHCKHQTLQAQNWIRVSRAHAKDGRRAASTSGDLSGLSPSAAGRRGIGRRIGARLLNVDGLRWPHAHTFF